MAVFNITDLIGKVIFSTFKIEIVTNYFLVISWNLIQMVPSNIGGDPNSEIHPYTTYFTCSR